MCSVDMDSTGNHYKRTRQSTSIDTNSSLKQETHPTRHQTETTETGTDTESTLPTELDSDETERLITRGDKREIGTTEQVRRESSELGLGVDTIRVQFHETRQFLSSESTVQINNGSDTDELDRGAFLQPSKVDQSISNVQKKN